MSNGFIKILRDLWLNRAHTILVVLTIALCVMLSIRETLIYQG